MHTFRLTCLLPSPKTLSDYEPISPIGKGAYGCSSSLELSDEAYAKLLSAVRNSFAKGYTVGVAPIMRPKAVFFDMDATVIAEESLVELARSVGKEKEVEAVTERAMAGELDFKAALIARVAVLQGLEQAVFAKVFASLTINPGAQEFMTYCRKIGVKTFLVSGGFTQLAEPLQRQLGFDDFYANTLEVTDGKLTGNLAGDIVDAEGKKSFMERTCSRLGFSLNDVAAVGDGANDIPMLTTAGIAIGHKPKPILLPYLHAQNAHGDHRFLAPLLFGHEKRTPD